MQHDPPSPRATPSIESALDLFIEEQPPNRQARCRRVIELFERHLNRGNAGQSGEPRGMDGFIRDVQRFVADGGAGELASDRELLPAARTLSKRLASWLEREGYLDPA